MERLITSDILKMFLLIFDLTYLESLCTFSIKNVIKLCIKYKKIYIYTVIHNKFVQNKR